MGSFIIGRIIIIRDWEQVTMMVVDTLMGLGGIPGHGLLR
ncbi:MAG: hypothetical protein JWM57_4043 [Phycisphaerales bacterium]|nr:hypothetical protein [Phycisphaerales bacterium]